MSGRFVLGFKIALIYKNYYIGIFPDVNPGSLKGDSGRQQKAGRFQGTVLPSGPREVDRKYAKILELIRIERHLLFQMRAMLPLF